MKKLVALVATVTLASTSVVACTPKPVSAEPVAEEFLEGMETRNNDGLAALTAVSYTHLTLPTKRIV